MKRKGLNCTQTSALLSFYAEGTLNLLLRKLVKDHLEKCPDCMAEYLNMLEKCNKTQAQAKNIIETDNYDTNQYKEFKTNLSAYIDNELSSDENLKIKKIAISNPLARKDLENIYKFKNLIYDSFVKTKESIKFDFSKQVLNEVQKELKHENAIEPINTAFIILMALVSSLTVGFIILLNYY